jgi:hypothetical protein
MERKKIRLVYIQEQPKESVFCIRQKKIGIFLTVRPFFIQTHICRSCKLSLLVENVSKVLGPQNCTYLEYCAMENCGGKIQFMAWSGALIPWGTFSTHVFTFRFLVFRFLWWIFKADSHSSNSYRLNGAGWPGTFEFTNAMPGYHGQGSNGRGLNVRGSNVRGLN